ncbi:hypothetical protein [uncultured Alsobacter sp.]|uniref:hypothetical protein n=1 Tax=uncultured Alsobacter sp. TaxID=1748258 RepID=UPI0025EF5900|nr:hypothetical protein [uncultured Alsobacter sp.]
MPQNRLTIVFVAALALSGAVVAFIVSRNPSLEQSAFPPFFWPLGLALLFDIASRPLIHQGKLPELPMQARFIGVIAGAIVYQLTRMVLPAA